MDGKEIPLQPDTEKSPFGSRERLTQFMKTDRGLVDYKQMVANTRVLALGETHTREITKEEVIDHIEQFKDLGFTHFGMEVFGTDAQQALDEYQSNGDKKDVLIEYLKKGFGGWSPRAGELYLQMVNEAKRAGMRVIGIDLPKSEQDQYPREGSDRDHKRDERMAHTVSEVLAQNPENKVVTFTGTAHAGIEGAVMAGLLASSGVEITTVSISGGSPSDRTLVEQSAVEAGIDKERFMIACRSRFKDSPTPYDWIIHLPQVEQETDFERMGRELGESLQAMQKREELFRPRMYPESRPLSYREEPIKPYKDLSPRVFPEFRLKDEPYTGIQLHKGGKRYLFDKKGGFTVMTPNFEGLFSNIISKPMVPDEIQTFIHDAEQQLSQEPQNQDLIRLLESAKSRFQADQEKRSSQ